MKRGQNRRQDVGDTRGSTEVPERSIHPLTSTAFFRRSMRGVGGRNEGSELGPRRARTSRLKLTLNRPARSAFWLTAKAVGKHPVPFRTRQLSPLAFRAVLK